MRSLQIAGGIGDPPQARQDWGAPKRQDALPFGVSLLSRPDPQFSYVGSRKRLYRISIMEPKIIEDLTLSGLNNRAATAIKEGWRPIGGPFVFREKVAWAFIMIPAPAPKPEQPPPTKEELIRAAVEGKTIVREG